ncbi:carboxypeptidase inhibitor-like [Haemaphysalis longicornis]
MTTAAFLFVVCFLAVLAYSQGNDCVSQGYGCVPAQRCPPQHRKNLKGCDTVCCDLGKLTGCRNRGGECSRASKCVELPAENRSCPRGQKCCVYVN